MNRVPVSSDKIIPVVVASELLGVTRAIARRISVGGMLVEMWTPLPLGTAVTIHVQMLREDGTIDEVVARAKVNQHHCLNYAGADGEARATRAIGLRFIDFDTRPDSERAPRLLH